MRIPVYLACETMRDTWDVQVVFRHLRLIRRSEEDRVIAVVEAPRGSRVVNRADTHGPDQLLVPDRSTLWSRLLHRRVPISAKYVISSARNHEHGLSIELAARGEGSPPEGDPDEPRAGEQAGGGGGAHPDEAS